MNQSGDTQMRYVGYYYEVKGQVKFSLLGNISIPWRDGRITIACKPFGWMFYLFEGAPHKPPKSFKLETWRVHELSFDNDCLKIEFRPDAVSIYFKMLEGEKDSERVKLAYDLIQKILKEDSFRSKGRFGPYPERDVYEAQRVLQVLVEQSRSRSIYRIMQKAKGVVTLSDLSDISDTELDDENDFQNKSSTEKSDGVTNLQSEQLYAVDSIYQAGDLVTNVTGNLTGSETGKRLGETQSDQGISCNASGVPERKSDNTHSASFLRKGETSKVTGGFGSEKSLCAEADNSTMKTKAKETRQILVSNDMKRKRSRWDSNEPNKSKVKKLEGNRGETGPEEGLDHTKQSRSKNQPSTDENLWQKLSSVQGGHFFLDRESKNNREHDSAQSYPYPNFHCSECNMKFQSNKSLALHLDAKHGAVKSTSSCHPKTQSLPVSMEQSTDKSPEVVNIEKSVPHSSVTSTLRTHGGFQFNCSQCNMKFLSCRSLNIHMEAKHGNNNTKTVDSNTLSLVSNTSSHLASKLAIPVEGDVNSVSTESHIATSNKREISSKLSCSECDMMFLSTKSLSIHMEAKHGIGKETTSTDMKMIKNQSKGNSVQLPGKSLKDIDAKPKSMKEAKREKRKRQKLEKYKCQSCGIAYLKKKHLESHMEKYASRNHEMYLMCFVCGYVSRNRDELRNHLRRKNHGTGFKIIADKIPDHCIQVREILLQEQILELSFFPDTDLMPICHFCGEGFTSIYKCQIHMKKVHKEESYMLGKVIECQTYAIHFKFCDHCNRENEITKGNRQEHSVSNCLKFTSQKDNENMTVVFCCPLGCTVSKHVSSVSSHVHIHGRKKGEMQITSIQALLIQLDQKHWKKYMKNEIILPPLK